MQATFGATELTSNAQDTFVMKLDASGNVLWAVKPLPESQGSRLGVGIAADGVGGFLLAGKFDHQLTLPSGATAQTAGCQDLFVYGLDAAGTATWGLTAGGTGCDEPTGIAADVRRRPHRTDAFATARRRS